MSEWKEFDGKTAFSGVFWVRGMRFGTDCDVDDYGKTIGWLTDEQTPFIALLEINFDPADGLELSPVNQYVTGDYDDKTDSITHYMEFAMPEGPAV